LNSQIVDLIKEKLGPNAKNIVIDQDLTGSPTPRDRLLTVFRRRTKRLSNDHAIYSDLVDFVTALERTEIDEPMYFWKCTVEGDKWGGWATSQSILYCINHSKLGFD